MDIVGAGILIEDLNGKVLVLHRKASVREGNKWGIPGGVIKETFGPIDTAIAKTLQEADLKFNEGDLTFLDKFHYQAENNNVTFYVWSTKIRDNSPVINLNTDGHDDFIWETPNELLKRQDLMVGMYPILKKFTQKS